MRQIVLVLSVLSVGGTSPAAAQPPTVESALKQLPSAGTPDRFPVIERELSPLLAVVTVTLQRVRPSERPGWLERIMEAVYRAPGLLGAHSATSFEHPGMVLIFTWWRDKQNLNDFFYSRDHQDWMRARDDALGGRHTSYFETIPKQVGIELFQQLPGGSAMGGGLVPDSVKGR